MNMSIANQRLGGLTNPYVNIRQIWPLSTSALLNWDHARRFAELAKRKTLVTSIDTT